MPPAAMNETTIPNSTPKTNLQRQLDEAFGYVIPATPMTDQEIEDRKAFLRRQAEQLKALYGVGAGPLASRVSGNDETASAAAATGD